MFRSSMLRSRFGGAVQALVLVLILTGRTNPAAAQSGTTNGEWKVNGGDTGSTRYSPLDQINASNVKNLQVVFRWKAQNMGPTAASGLGSYSADGGRQVVCHGRHRAHSGRHRRSHRRNAVAL